VQLDHYECRHLLKADSRMSASVGGGLFLFSFSRLRDCCVTRLRDCCVVRLRDCCVEGCAIDVLQGVGE
jgi:hypothetical protein